MYHPKFEMNFYEEMHWSKPEQVELETEADIENYARDLAGQYSSKEDYEKNKPPPDWSDLDRILKEYS